MKRNRGDDEPDHPRARAAGEEDETTRTTDARRRLAAFALAVFAVAFGVRLVTWGETRAEVGKVQTTVTAGYKRDARYLLGGGIGSFFSPASPLADPDSLGHPPGYPILLAFIFKLFGDSDAGVQLLQVFCDALSCVVLALIVAESLNLPTALVAGLLAAVSPQLAWNSVLLLPDSLSVLPVLCAVYLIARARRRSTLAQMFLAGALVGVSCWLRANALLLAPALAVLVFFLSARARRLRPAASLLCGAVLVVGALTVRNAVAFRAFVPVSLGAGQTLLEGIGDYDRQQRFGVPATDVELQRQEADASARPDYNDSLLGTDGIRRERARLRRGFSVVAAHPFWFASVMLRRASSMLRLERARRASISTGVGLLQRLYITAVFLPLALAGALILARRRRWRALAVLLAVPAYYLCFQSAFHTEYRYTLALTYFLFALSAVALTTLCGALRRRLARVSR